MRIYDETGKATCVKCGSDMQLSGENNYNGPKCLNTECDGGIGDAEYYDTVPYAGFGGYTKQGERDMRGDLV